MKGLFTVAIDGGSERGRDGRRGAERDTARHRFRAVQSGEVRGRAQSTSPRGVGGVVDYARLRKPTDQRCEPHHSAAAMRMMAVQ
jgi:hypothetical protein